MEEHSQAPVSSSGLHNELSAGASSGKQECLESESSRPCTSGMEAFCTNCTSSCGGGREGRKNNMGVQCKCKCSQTTRTTSTVNKKKKKEKKRERWQRQTSGLESSSSESMGHPVQHLQEQQSSITERMQL